MRFENPGQDLINQQHYGDDEVGITHPNNTTFFRINDAGDAELVVNDNLAIILHAASNSVVIVADNVKILTKDGDSIRWNNKNLNSRATDFTQPALVPVELDEMRSIYHGSEDYYPDEEDS